MPDKIRLAIWYWITDIRELYLRKHAKNLYSKLLSLPGQYDDQINKDVPRTFGNILDEKVLTI